MGHHDRCSRCTQTTCALLQLLPEIFHRGLGVFEFTPEAVALGRVAVLGRRSGEHFLQFYAEPLDLAWADDHSKVVISWSDGHTSRYDLVYLRRICPCAICRNSHATPPISTTPKAPFRILDDAQMRMARASAKARSAYPIGNYAVAFQWDDGHDDGIYSWALLRGMCPCAECVARTEAPK